MSRVTWPQPYRMSVTLCFDVDAESAWIADPDNQRRLSLLSAAAFGRRVGVVRILDLLDRHSLRANFFIPGYTAELDPQIVAEICRRGHPIGCHGYLHERTDTLSEAEEDDILRRSVERLQSVAG
ncbi:MAG: polysaccharide deacetylase family protein, partial [Alicyclobacillus sp.]|nr:polysaccharide deacetylase family protein [Alicyclobacillus sp.]